MLSAAKHLRSSFAVAEKSLLNGLLRSIAEFTLSDK